MFIIGETETVDEVALPAFALQVYVVAPPPVRTALCPTQIAVGDATEVTVGFGETVSKTVCVAVQFPLAPITVYVSLATGETETVDVIALPAFALHVYVVAPDAVNVTALPLQIVVLDCAIVTVGIGVTFMETVCVDVHPLAGSVTVSV